METDDRVPPKKSSDNSDKTRLATDGSLGHPPQQPNGDDQTRLQSHPIVQGLPDNKADDANRALSSEKGVRNQTQSKKDGPNKAAPKETEYTEYHVKGQSKHSTGFEKAKAIANKALASKGKILKKRFVLEEIIGKGGMGVVYKARDLRKVEAEDPNPFVVAKVLGQNFKDHPDAFVVLQQEAAKSQRIAHPNIVTVHDFDRDGNTIYITMELLEGHPLDELLQSHKDLGLPKDQVMPLFKDLCEALSYAHEHQLIHADFKPGNVFISDGGTAKVLDFGIARAASEESHKYKYDVGELGALTPAYATIEMVKGKAPTFSDDVYALACVLYEMLAGKHPYGKHSADAAQKKGLQPERIAALNNKEWKALAQGMAFKQQDRFGTVDAFYQAFIPRRRSKSFIIATALLITALCGLGWLGYYQYRNKQLAQSTITEKLFLAQECHNSEDYACAIEQSLVVINLAPGNTTAKQIHAEATQALERKQISKKISALLDQATTCFNEQDYPCAKLRIIELLSLSPDNAEAKSLQSKIEQGAHTQKVAIVVLQGEECIERSDLDCAMLFYKKAIKIDADHPLVSKLGDRVETLQTKIKAKSIERGKTIDRLIKNATACQQKKKYDCVIKFADQALALDRNNSDAIQMKSEAVFSKKRRQENDKKVSLLVQQGQACLKKGNFNCALAKAESALDVLPGNEEALKLKKTTTDKQNELKKSLKIN